MFWRRNRRIESQDHEEQDQQQQDQVEQGDEARRCPHCDGGVEHWVPILYGMVGEQIQAQVDRGEVVLGGGNYGRNEPAWYCSRCYHTFGRAREDRDRFGRVLDQGSPDVRVGHACDPLARPSIARRAFCSPLEQLEGFAAQLVEQQVA